MCHATIQVSLQYTVLFYKWLWNQHHVSQKFKVAS